MSRERDSVGRMSVACVDSLFLNEVAVGRAEIDIRLAECAMGCVALGGKNGYLQPQWHTEIYSVVETGKLEVSKIGSYR